MAGQMADDNAAIRARKLWASPAERVGRGVACRVERSLSWCRQVSPMGVLLGRIKHVGQRSHLAEKFLPRPRNVFPMAGLSLEVSSMPGSMTRRVRGRGN